MNKIQSSPFALLMIVGCFVLNGIAVAASSSVNEGLKAMLDKVAERIKSYPELKNWTASVVSAQMEVDKQWRPKKTIRVLKIVRSVERKRSEEIVRAEEIEKGVTKDITQKYIRELEERRQEQRKREAERKREARPDDGERQRRRSFDVAEIFPFGERSREKYVFSRLADEMFEGRPVFVLQARAKIRTEETWEGRYFISQDSYDVLKAILNLAKNPKFVKEFTAEIEFQVLPSGHFFIKKSKIKVDGGIILKNVRMVIEEEYSNYEVIEGETAVLRGISLYKACS